jgi:hypothetical protein
MVLLGEKWQGDAIRVVKVEVDGKELLLATDLEIEAELTQVSFSPRKFGVFEVKTRVFSRFIENRLS